MKKIIRLLSILSIFLLITLPLCHIGLFQSVVPTDEMDGELRAKAVSPIYIDGNYWLGQNATSGSGNKTHPYIIENLIINASGENAHGICINNTDAYFIIRNCTVTNADTGFQGIMLENVTYGTVTNNTANYNGDLGILLKTSSNNTLSNNTAFGNGAHGFYLFEYSNNNTLTGNTAKNNTWHGIRLKWSDYNTLRENFLINNTAHGIYLWEYCDLNTLTSNTASENGWDGINLEWYCDNNTITNNFVNNNTQFGVTLKSNCFNNTLTNNTAMGNSRAGFYSWLSGADNKWINNTANNNAQSGIYLGTGSEYATLIGNTAENNKMYGINASSPGGTVMTNNSANNNDMDGIYLFMAYRCNLTSNTANNNGFHGIRLKWSDNNTLISNVVKNNTGTGIRFEGLSYKYNNVTTNSIMFNGNYGIYTEGSNSSFYRNLLYMNVPTDIYDGGTGNVWVEYLIPEGEDWDGDGIPNGWELVNGLNIWNSSDALDDFDMDGLTNLGEFGNGTDPNNPDTDGDSLNDSAEVNIHGTDPNDEDSDDDLMLDGWETLHSLNPLNQIDALVDYDGDGLKNLEESNYNSDPRDQDSDDDGYSDGAEVAAGTDPLNPSSHPTESTPTDYTLSIILGLIIVAISVSAAIIIHGLLVRPKSSEPPAPKKLPPTPKNK